MRYRIGILEKDEMYLEKLVEFLRRNHSDILEINMVDESGMDWSNVNLSDYHIDAEDYDALFIGDGIYLEHTGMPQDTKIAYLTADGSRTGKNRVAKYQRLEQIYQQMIDICAAEDISCENDSIIQSETPEYDVGQRFNDVMLKTEYINGKTYRVYQIPDSRDICLDKVEMGMISNNRIQGLAEMTCVGSELRYQITNKVCLVDFVCKNHDYFGKTKLLRIFHNILDTMLGLEDYMLLADKLLLKLQDIYLDENTLEPALLYCPLQETREVRNVSECLAELIVLCGELFNKLKEHLETCAEGEPEGSENIEDNDSTEVFAELQNAAEEGRRQQSQTEALQPEDGIAYLMRKKTGEKILINRVIFKLGKEENYVDYCIKGNPTVSRNHADIVKKPEGFYVVDKGSLNHTFLNGRRIGTGEYEKLESGDLVQIADEVFEFTIQSSK